MSRKSKLTIALGVAALIIAIGAMGLAGRKDELMVHVETVSRRDLVATFTADGWIRPRRAVDIQSDLMGRITRIWVREGDSVQTGQVLLQLDPTEYEAAAARARAAAAEAAARLAQTRASLLQAERVLARTRAIAERDSSFVSQQTLEDAITQVEVQRALVEAANHGITQANAILREAEDRLAKTTIRAPIAGVVTRLNVEAGETAIVGTTNNPGSLLLTISDLSVMEAVVRVDQTDLRSLELGDSATIELDAFPRQSFTGTVTAIAHSSVVPRKSVDASPISPQQQQAVDFEVVITIDSPPERLRPDLSATAKIVTATREDALAIPIIALTIRDLPAPQPLVHEDDAARAAADAATSPSGDHEGVFVIRDGRAHFVPVTVGIADATHFEVLSGLEPGDQIVAGPYEVIRNLHDGAAVRSIGGTQDGVGR